VDYINRISIPYIKGGVKAPSFLTGFTFLPIISSSHFPIISEAWAATYYVDATNGNDVNNGLSMSSAWKTTAKVNASRFNPGDQILFNLQTLALHFKDLWLKKTPCEKCRRDTLNTLN